MTMVGLRAVEWLRITMIELTKDELEAILVGLTYCQEAIPSDETQKLMGRISDIICNYSEYSCEPHYPLKPKPWILHVPGKSSWEIRHSCIRRIA